LQSAQTTKFTHLWSLSVEIQFYIIAPALTLSYCSEKLKYLTIIFIAILSFFYQLTAEGNTEHMALFSRLWQFMFGFLAFHLSQSKYLKEGSSTLLTLALIVLVSIELLPHKQMHRIAVSIITLLLLAKPSANPILCSWPLTFLGDCSYSIYLVHWPLIKWTKYANLGGHQSLVVGSILLGCIVEKGYGALISVRIKGWISLLVILSMLYGSIFGCLFYLAANKPGDEVGLLRC
jgi:peptidoglycan/LPS O-acetylase OafA/YrhL